MRTGKMNTFSLECITSKYITPPHARFLGVFAADEIAEAAAAGAEIATCFVANTAQLRNQVNTGLRSFTIIRVVVRATFTFLIRTAKPPLTMVSLYMVRLYEVTRTVCRAYTAKFVVNIACCISSFAHTAFII